MKKVKIMMLSLVLLAVVGGALAFKAKGPNTFCTINALYYDPSGTEFDQYYCVWDVEGQPAPTFGDPFATIGCNKYTPNVAVIAGAQTVCTTVAPLNVDTDAECTTIACPNLARTVKD